MEPDDFSLQLQVRQFNETLALRLNGYEKPGLFIRGRIRDLSGIVDQIDSLHLASRAQKLAQVETESLPLVSGSPRLGVPYIGIGKFIAIGLNYADHAAESGVPVPAEPIIFMKATTCINGPNDDIVLPKNSTKADWEVELGVVIGTMAQYVTLERALDYVAGYCVVNDVSERQFQLAWQPMGQRQRVRHLRADRSVSGDARRNPDPQKLDMWLDVSGERMQRGSTSTMVFGCAHLVSYVSQFMTLMPGDIITTGTPPGVGMGKAAALFKERRRGPAGNCRLG